MKSRYILLIFISTSVYLCQQLNFKLPYLINNYLNDLLCLPIILSITKFVLKIITKKNFNISLLCILAIATFYSIYFEWYLPKHNERYTSDLIDIILYFIGGLVYYINEKKPFQMERLFRYKKQ